MKKTILLAALALSACGNETRNVRAAYDAAPHAGLSIVGCSVSVSRSHEGNFGTYGEAAHVVVWNKSSNDVPARIRLTAIGKDGSTLTETILSASAKAGTTTSLEGMKTVPAPVGWIEDRDFEQTDSYRCRLTST